MRQPTRTNFEQQIAINAQCGFHDMFALLDCMHYQWKKCPMAWQRNFGDKDGKISIILEAIADHNVHI